MSFYTKVGKAREKALGNWKWRAIEDDDVISIDVLAKLMAVAMKNNDKLPTNFEIKIHDVSTDLLKKFLEDMLGFNVKEVKCIDNKELFRTIYMITLNEKDL